MTEQQRTWYRTLGRYLAYQRKKRRLEQAEIAKALQLSNQGVVSKIENSNRKMPVLELTRLAQLYQCSIDKLIP